jgi:peptidoglycan/xylan/chitin deacetylase (PgdA/CDA1 family)
MGQQPMSARYAYSPIINRPAGRWPNGRKLAVYIAIGVEDYRPDGGLTEDILPGVPAPDAVNASWRDYGNRVGAFRLLERLTRMQMPATILLNTLVYDTAPDVVSAARRAGAEIVAHGISNSDTLAGRSVAQETDYVREVARRIQQEEGAAPGGWSSPWLTHTDSTIDVLAEAGYRYLLDLRLDDQPVWLPTSSSPLLALPYPLELNDSSTMVGRLASAHDFAEMVIDEFDELLAAADEQPLVMGLVTHSFISGAPFRLRALTSALRHMAQAREEVWFTVPARIHQAWTEMQPARALR